MNPAYPLFAALLAPVTYADQGVAEAEGPSTPVAEVTVYGRARAEGYGVESTATATRTDTALEDTPQSVAIVTRAAIEDQAMDSMADVVRYVPGVTMGQGEGHRDAPTIRGQATTADFFTDGVRDDVQYYRDVYNLERVEVLRGPNAMIFGRGGGGGVINRVTKTPFSSVERGLSVELGSFDHRRATLDLNQPLGAMASGRLNLVIEDSGSYRDHVGVERWGINPTVAFTPSEQLSFVLSYEHFEDERTVDRGVPSYLGRPLETDVSTFFGDPDLSYSTADVDWLSGAVQWVGSNGLIIRNRTVLAAYDKFYQNVYPGAVGGGGSTVSISAYNNLTSRENLFTQTDFILETQTGSIGHRLLAGVELGRQDTRNFRETGYFGGTATSITVPVASPTLSGMVVDFRQSASDADNDGEASILGLYVQDQIQLNPQWQVVAGLRFDSFGLDLTNNRTGDRFERTDEMVSPRLGVIYQPTEALSFYGSYARSFLPASGDQFASLSASNLSLEPEEFINHELGARWEPVEGLMLSAALYRLERSNTTARDPLDPALIVQTGEQRTEGLELGLSGQITERWEIMGGYAWQDAKITSDTTAAPAGRTVPLVPEHSASLWNRYQFDPRWAAGLGIIHQGQVFAGIDNAVVLPSFTRVDAAVFYDVSRRIRVQANVENLFDERYWSTAHSNNNITPGSPRALRVSLTARF
ncbi:TonB-dependent siderophore receptor [Brevundimonas sp. 2R-24]|uniref:TonB-dependent siderophore receptor n=1 Tax=Peiella sedimenti TaxID=3061083 RepID=A0ABT8SP00_9CAUL|nr:TonB-dependent siderophore receptor [Caulobacteraceae bacterium XZ-24]